MTISAMSVAAAAPLRTEASRWTGFFSVNLTMSS
jgi:hypothetical protein